MTEKELFDEMKSMTFIEIHSDNLQEIIESRERKSWEASRELRDETSCVEKFYSFDNYKNSEEYRK